MKTPRIGMAFQILLFLVTMAVLATPVSATPVFSVNPTITNTVKVSRFITPAGDSYDIRGIAALDVLNPSPIGSVFLVDPAFGTDLDIVLDSAGLPFGNRALFGLSLGPTQLIGVLFDFAHPVFDPGKLDMLALGLPIIPSLTTDPALNALDRILAFNFKLSDVADFTDGTHLATYQFAGVIAQVPDPVPEPSTISFLACGLAIIGVTTRLRWLRRM